MGLVGYVEVEYEVVDRLDLDWRTGKFRRLVSQVGPPDDLSADRPRGALVRAGRDERPDLSPSLIASGGSGA